MYKDLPIKSLEDLPEKFILVGLNADNEIVIIKNKIDIVETIGLLKYVSLEQDAVLTFEAQQRAIEEVLKEQANNKMNEGLDDLLSNFDGTEN